MPSRIEYFYALISPWTYMGHRRFLDIAKRHKAEIWFRPMDLSRVFPATGGLALSKRAPARLAYRLVELERWRKHLGVPLNIHPKHFPASEALAAPLVIAAGERGHDMGRLSEAILRAVWSEERNIADPETLAAILTEQKMPSDELMEAARADEMRHIWDTNTQEAIDKNVFGAPFYIYKGEPFWGQDRLDFLDRALAG
jgi:2-hydroxychromene-2-carboxylate isomerase